jgi:type II secretory pathway pseudopilin PulG
MRSSSSHLPIHACSPSRGSRLPALAGFTPARRGGIHGPPSSDPPKDGFAVANLRPLPATPKRCEGGTAAFTLPKLRGRSCAFTLLKPRGRFRAFTLQKVRARTAFTLIELLIVTGIIALLMVLVIPAFTNIKSGGDVTGAAYTIKGVLDQARTYAMANNTYAWVGFYEENTTATSPTNTSPAYSGHGRLVIAAIYSIDGTKIFQDTDSPASLPTNRYKQIGKLLHIDGIHASDIGSPTPSPTPGSDNLNTRPNSPYAENSPSSDHFNRISSDSADTTRFSFSAQNYTFYKTVRFAPTGEVDINYASDTTATLKHAIEIGLRPTHGNAVDSNTPNIVAIQVTGDGGNVKIYRR